MDVAADLNGCFELEQNRLVDEDVACLDAEVAQLVLFERDGLGRPMAADWAGAAAGQVRQQQARTAGAVHAPASRRWMMLSTSTSGAVLWASGMIMADAGGGGRGDAVAGGGDWRRGHARRVAGRRGGLGSGSDRAPGRRIT